MPNLDDICVSRNRLSEQLASQLKALMATRELNPGDRLPSERELAEKFGVSRAILREAIKSLEQQGLLSVQVGRGTFVTSIAPKDLSDSLADSLDIMMRQKEMPPSLQYFFEVRQMLEIESARIAAMNATEEDIARLEQSLGQMRQKIDTDIEQFLQADTEFHQYLARATQNPLFETLLMTITKMLSQITRRASISTRGPESAIEYHSQILDAVRKHDPDACQLAMRQHLENVFSRLEQK